MLFALLGSLSPESNALPGFWHLSIESQWMKYQILPLRHLPLGVELIVPCLGHMPRFQGLELEAVVLLRYKMI